MVLTESYTSGFTDTPWRPLTIGIAITHCNTNQATKPCILIFAYLSSQSDFNCLGYAGENDYCLAPCDRVAWRGRWQKITEVVAALLVMKQDKFLRGAKISIKTDEKTREKTRNKR